MKFMTWPHREALPGGRRRLPPALCRALTPVWLAAAVLAHAADPGATGADDAVPTDRDLKGMGLEDLVAVEIPTVFGASKHLERVTDAPSAISLVTADEIRRFGHRTLADVLDSVRGFYTTYDRTYGHIGVRGFNRPGDFGGRTLILINGHRLNEPLFDSAFNQTDFLLDVDLIDRVEVIRGPGSLLYGNNAFFGVINVVTRQAAQVDGAEVSASYASFETATGRLTYGKRFANGIGLLVSGSLHDSKGRTRIYVPEYDAPESNFGIAEERDEDQFASGFLSLDYGPLKLEAGLVRRDKNAALAPYGTIFNVAQPTIDTRGYFNFSYQDTLGDDWELSARAFYDQYRLEIDYPYDTADPGQPRALRWNIERDRAEWFGFETQVSRTFLERHRMTAGFEARHDFTLSMASHDTDPYEPVFDYSDQKSQYGTFLQDEYSIVDGLTLDAGFRYDHYASIGSTVNPRAALIYHPAESTTFKALFGQAYRAPNIWESDFETFYQRGNPDLDPEIIRSYELVLEQYLTPEVRVGLSGYLNDTEDLIAISASNDPADPRDTFFNLDQARTLGMEVEAEYRAASGWLARASYTLQRTEDGATGEELSNSPRHLIKGNFSAPLWRDRVFAGLELQYTSRARTLAGRAVTQADAFWVANFTLYSRELAPGLEASATLYNLFDARYGHPAGDEYLPAVIEQDGRSFRAKLTYKF